MAEKTIKSALISVFHKDGIDRIAKLLNDLGVTIYSTGGTQSYLESMDIPVVSVDSLTHFPEILGGRVKTLHPKVFGGILNRRDLDSDQEALLEHDIPQIDLVIVDLYPFEKTVLSKATHQDIIEKIDIGGISLIRAAAKNYHDVVIIPSVNQYEELNVLLKNQNGKTTLEQRKRLAAEAFQISSHYDTAIFDYLADDEIVHLKISQENGQELRYGENPHQRGWFFGNLHNLFEKLNGKELSYNNLLDIDAAMNLMEEFQTEGPTFAILKHNNACGISSSETIEEAYDLALAADPVSAFGGVLISNAFIDLKTAQKINSLFCEVLIAPGFDEEGLELLKSKKNRIILLFKDINLNKKMIRTALNGYLVQDKDDSTEKIVNLVCKTKVAPTNEEIEDLLFANKIVKHTKSNTIVLVKNQQLLASGTGQTSRVDALNQAIHKAKSFNFNLDGAVMASDAFFPFPDCVEIANKEGIKSVIQPGGSIKDELSINYCDENKMAMVFTGVRHFKH